MAIASARMPLFRALWGRRRLECEGEQMCILGFLVRVLLWLLGCILESAFWYIDIIYYCASFTAAKPKPKC